MRKISSYDEMGSGVKIGIFAAFDAPGHGAHIVQSHETLRHQFLQQICIVDGCADNVMTGLASVAVGRCPANSSRDMFGVAPGASLIYDDGYRVYNISDDQLDNRLQCLLNSNQQDVDILIILPWSASNLGDDFSDCHRLSASSATLQENILDTYF